LLARDKSHSSGPGAQQHTLTTSTDLLFFDQTDGFTVAMDATNGSPLWRFQTGAAGSSGVITYMARGRAIRRGFGDSTGIPYNPPGGDTL